MKLQKLLVENPQREVSTKVQIRPNTFSLVDFFLQRALELAAGEAARRRSSCSQKEDVLQCDGGRARRWTKNKVGALQWK